jgi:hypothetical protein
VSEKRPVPAKGIPDESKYFMEALRWAQKGDCNCFACWVLRNKLGQADKSLMSEYETWRKAQTRE